MNTCPDARTGAVESLGCGNALHNMSAPPRSRMTVQPLRPAGNLTTVSAAPAGPRSSGGLAWLMRIDLDRLIKAHLSDFESWVADGELHPGGTPAASGDGLAVEAASLPAHLTGDHYLRLRCCVAIARAMAWGVPVTNHDVEALRSLPHETLCDELRGLNAAIDPTPLQLPALGIMTRPDDRNRTSEGNPARVFFTLSRLSGSTFVRSASAMVAGNMPRNITFDLWIPS
jgi:hypothetical protein